MTGSDDRGPLCASSRAAIYLRHFLADYPISVIPGPPLAGHPGTVRQKRASLRGIMENDAEGVALAAAHTADAVAHGDAIGAADTVDRAMVHRKDHRLALAQRHHLATRLHPRPLLDQQELAAGKIAPRIAEQHRQLQRKD